MAQCLMTFAVISPIEPSLPITVDGIMDPGLPPHTPYLGTPVVFPPGQRPVSFCFGSALRSSFSYPKKYRLRQTAAIKIKVSNVYTIPGQNTMDHLMIVTCTKWI